jgi:hypothetical protein
MLFACAWAFQSTGGIWNWITLLLCSVATLGLTSSGIFVVPMALGIAGVAAWRREFTWRTVATLLPALYPLAWGLALRGSFHPLVDVFGTRPPSPRDLINDVYGPHVQVLLLFGLLAAPPLAPSRMSRQLLAGAALLFLLGPLNPLLTRVIVKLTTTEVLWRTLWSLPVAGFVAVALVGIGAAIIGRWPRAGIAAVALISIFGVYHMRRYSTLRADNRVSFSTSPYRIPPRDWDIATSAVARAPAGTSILGPELIVAWVPLMQTRPDLVSLRPAYDEQMGVRMPADEAEERRRLRELVSGEDASWEEVQRLLDALPKYSVGLIVTRPREAARLGLLLTARGYALSPVGTDYVFFVRSN